MKLETWMTVVVGFFALVGLTVVLAWLAGVYPFESDEAKHRRQWEERMGVQPEVRQWGP